MFSLLKSLDGRLRKLSCTINMSVSHTFPVTAQSFYPQFFNTLFPTQHTHTLEGAHTHKPWDKPLAGTQIRNRTKPSISGQTPLCPERKSATRCVAGPSERTHQAAPSRRPSTSRPDRLWVRRSDARRRRGRGAGWSGPHRAGGPVQLGDVPLRRS